MVWFWRKRYPVLNKALENQIVSLAGMVEEYRGLPNGYAKEVKLQKINARLRSLQNSLR